MKACRDCPYFQTHCLPQQYCEAYVEAKIAREKQDATGLHSPHPDYRISGGNIYFQGQLMGKVK